MAERIMAVMPAMLARKTHLSHITCRIVSLRAWLTGVLANSASRDRHTASARGDPSRGPNAILWNSPRCRMVPSAPSVEAI